MDRTRRLSTTRTTAKVPGQTASIAADVLTFVLAASGVFVVHFVGDLPLADILLIPVLPFLITLKRQRLNRPRFRTIFVLLGLWLSAQIVTDAYRGTEMVDWMRVDARIFFIAANLLGMAVLVGRNVRRHTIFFAGYAVGALLQVKFQPTELSDSWKFGYSTGVTAAVVLLSCYFFMRRRYSIVILLILGIASVDAAVNFRSPILFLFITIVLVTPLIPEQIGEVRLLPAAGSGMRVFVLALMALTAAKAAGSLVLFLGNQGVLGEDAKSKNESQADSKAGQLIGGRPEILISSRAVMDSPFLGHGAWAKDMRYVEMYHDIMVEYGEDRDNEADLEEASGLIPTHSHLMDAWVDAGILGAVFWGYVLFLNVKGLIITAMVKPPLAPMYIYSLIGFIWNIFFSPPGGITILPETFLIIVIFDLIESTSVAKSLPHLPNRARRVLVRQFRAPLRPGRV